jgi:GrpB-like predicted nucleotidyltransferase (UPF0157 family)
MLGLPRDAVKLMPHTELWHEFFTEEKARLRDALGGYTLTIEHVGSTAVCVLSAKPIINIAVAARRMAAAESCMIPLEGFASVGIEHSTVLRLGVLFRYEH